MHEGLNQADADLVYEQLLDAHSGLDAAQSALLNARLILLLANQLGNAKVIGDLISAARNSAEFPAPEATPA